MTEEVWKPIIGYENKYEVSNLGKIKSLLYNKEKILKIEEIVMVMNLLI